MRSTSTSGASALTGTRYSPRLVLAQPARAVSIRLPSSSAWPIPHSMPPMSWLRAVLGLRIRPGANAPAMCRTRTMPSSASTATFANWAPKVSSPYGVSSGGGSQLPMASASVIRCRPIKAAYVSPVPAAGRGDRSGVGAVQRGLRVGGGQRDQLVADRGAGVVHGGTDHHRAVGADRRAGARQAGVAELDPDVAQLDAERVGGDLGQHGGRAGAEFLGGGLHDGGAV